MATATKKRGAPKLLLSPQEVADSLGVGATFARGLIKDGDLRGVKVGRLTKVPVSEVERYVLGSSRPGVRFASLRRRGPQARSRAGTCGP
jgi:excisionase family DNA binding protein